MKPAVRQWAALGALCLSLLVVSIDSGILNVALPTLVRDLGATPSQLEWIVDSYTLIFAGLLLTSGSIGDRFGRRGTLTVGLVIFGCSSLGASLSDTPTELTVWRGIMGVGAALIMPATLSILVNVFTEERARRRAIAYWSLMNATGAFIGPVAGGLILRHFWWGACFLVNVPVVLVALGAQRLLPTSRNPNSARFDLPGAALSTVALAVLLWGLIEGPTRGWLSPSIVGTLTLSLLLFGVFAWWETRARSPVIDLAMLRKPQLTAAATAMTIAFIAMTGSMFLIVQSLQIVKGYSPLVAALATSGPITVVNFLLMPRSPGLTERFGARWMIAAGSILTAAAALVISLTTVDSGYANLLIGFALMAAAFSIFVPASTEAIMTAVPKEMAGGASAINQTSRQLGQALGIAIGGSIAATGYRSGFEAVGLPLRGASRHEASSSITGALSVGQHLSGVARQDVLLAGYQAFLHGIRWSLFVAAGLATAAATLAAVAVPAHRRAREAEPLLPGGEPASAPLGAEVDDLDGEGRPRASGQIRA